MRERGFFYYQDGSIEREWFFDKPLHRLDGPAMEYSNYRAWFVEGKRHRVDGPAREWTSGAKEWYIDDKLHRVDGPAVESPGLPEIYYAYHIDGLFYPKKQFDELIEQVKQMSVAMKLTDPRWWVRELGKKEVV